jgi:predicted RNase H-like HicB family nuclease
MADHTYTVRADWDEQAATWVAEGEDVPGLVTGADTFEALVEKLRVMVPEMLELNGVLSAEEAAAARFTVIAHRTEHARAVA